MESRRIIHYNRNTIKPRKLSKPSVFKRMRLGSGNIQQANHNPPTIEKVYATKNCSWCPADFDRFRIKCLNCSNCQYCGLSISDNNRCIHCGNHLPDDMQIRTEVTKIRFF